MNGYALGRIIGMFLWPLIFGLIIAFAYSKIRKRKFNWLIVVVAGTTIFILLALGRIGSGISEQITFKDDFVYGFVDECKTSGYPEEFCNCAAKNLVENNSPEELTEIVTNFQAGKYQSPEDVPSTFKASFEKCADLQKI